ASTHRFTLLDAEVPTPNPGGQDHIHPTPETDVTDPLAARYRVAGFHIGVDAPGERARDLDYSESAAVDPYLLVSIGIFRKRRSVRAGRVDHRLHDARQRRTVDVDIGNAHIDPDTESVVFSSDHRHPAV